MLKVNPELDVIMSPLFAALPLESAMPFLVPSKPVGGEAARLAAAIERELPTEELKAGLWLYVDDLDRSHRISQGIGNQIGSFWHAIMHRREADFSNSKYWFRQAGPPPFNLEDYDPARFVDEVAAAHGSDSSALLEIQRKEWAALFGYCAELADWDER